MARCYDVAMPEPSDSRRHPRYELYASVELQGAGETLILPARNISLGGMFVDADGHDLSAFPIGAVLSILVFDAADESGPTVRATAAVLRHDPEGIALKWDETNAENQKHLQAVLDSLAVVDRFSARES
jgi:hypothetical protein